MPSSYGGRKPEAQGDQGCVSCLTAVLLPHSLAQLPDLAPEIAPTTRQLHLADSGGVHKKLPCVPQAVYSVGLDAEEVREQVGYSSLGSSSRSA